MKLSRLSGKKRGREGRARVEESYHNENLNILNAAVVGLMMSAPVAFADDITFAVVGPMTGQLATIGDQFKQGAQAAADAINAAGGVDGRQIKIDIEDDQCDPKQAVSVANRIVANGVKFIDGHACSGSSIPASAVYAEAGALMMSPASSNPVLTDDAAAKRLADDHAPLHA